VKVTSEPENWPGGATWKHREKKKAALRGRFPTLSCQKAKTEEFWKGKRGYKGMPRDQQTIRVRGGRGRRDDQFRRMNNKIKNRRGVKTTDGKKKLWKQEVSLSRKRKKAPRR